MHSVFDNYSAADYLSAHPTIVKIELARLSLADAVLRDVIGVLENIEHKPHSAADKANRFVVGRLNDVSLAIAFSLEYPTARETAFYVKPFRSVRKTKWL